MKIYITPEAKQLLELYVDEVEDEISGLGKVRKIGNRIVIEDVYLLKQDSGTSTTDLDMAAVAELMTEMIENKGPVEHLKLWWHSHGNMGAFWSGTDENTIVGFENDWMVSLVVNRKGEYKCRLDVYSPVHLVVESAELCITSPEPSKELREYVKREVAEKVKVKKWSNFGGDRHYMGFQGYQGGHEIGGYNRGIDIDNRFGPVPSTKSLEKAGKWKNVGGVWMLADKDDKEEVSSTGKVAETKEAKSESKGEAEKLEEGWEEIGFQPPHKWEQ